VSARRAATEELSNQELCTNEYELSNEGRMHEEIANTCTHLSEDTGRSPWRSLIHRGASLAKRWAKLRRSTRLSIVALERIDMIDMI